MYRFKIEWPAQESVYEVTDEHVIGALLRVATNEGINTVSIEPCQVGEMADVLVTVYNLNNGLVMGHGFYRFEPVDFDKINGEQIITH